MRLLTELLTNDNIVIQVSHIYELLCQFNGFWKTKWVSNRLEHYKSGTLKCLVTVGEARLPVRLSRVSPDRFRRRLHGQTDKQHGVRWADTVSRTMNIHK